jgi:hypothetical protein
MIKCFKLKFHEYIILYSLCEIDEKNPLCLNQVVEALIGYGFSLQIAYKI